MKTLRVLQPEDRPVSGQARGALCARSDGLGLEGRGRPGSQRSGVFTTVRHRTTEAVAALLATWTAEVPPGTALGVEVRVGSGREAYGPWFELGRRGVAWLLDAALLPPDEPDRGELDFELARLHVDWLEARRPVSWWQLRFTLSSVMPEGGPRVRGWAVSATGKGPDDGSDANSGRSGLPVERRRPDRVVLPVPFRSQRWEERSVADRICLPTSLAMAAEYLGVVEPTMTWARLCHDPRHAIFGNWAYAVAAAGERGLRGWAELGSTTDEVLDVVAAGWPVIMSIRYERGALDGAAVSETAGHLVLLVGWEDGGRRLLFHDPAGAGAAEGRERSYRRDQIEAAWHRGLAIHLRRG